MRGWAATHRRDGTELPSVRLCQSASSESRPPRRWSPAPAAAYCSRTSAEEVGRREQWRWSCCTHTLGALCVNHADSSAGMPAYK
jgi:hypothetical protein